MVTILQGEQTSTDCVGTNKGHTSSKANHQRSIWGHCDIKIYDLVVGSHFSFSSLLLFHFILSGQALRGQEAVAILITKRLYSKPHYYTVSKGNTSIEIVLIYLPGMTSYLGITYNTYSSYVISYNTYSFSFYIDDVLCIGLFFSYSSWALRKHFLSGSRSFAYNIKHPHFCWLRSTHTHSKYHAALVYKLANTSSVPAYCEHCSYYYG